MPPLTTRPKAATVGVGRQVILRPAVQKRYVELDEPTLADQRTDLRPAARRHRRPRARRSTCTLCAGCRRCCATADFKVTAVIVDERAHRRRARRHDRGSGIAIAFDLGTTTVVATLLDLTTGTPAAVASMLNKQQPFGGDVITRISATMMDPEAAPPAPAGCAPTRSPSWPNEVCARGRRRPAAGLRDRHRRQRHDDRARAGHRPGAARRRAVRDDDRAATRRCSQPTWDSTCTRVPGRSCFPALGAYVGGDIVAGMLATGMDRDKRTRLFIDVGTNCEIVAQRRRPHPVDRRSGRARRSRAARSGAACGPPTVRSRSSSCGDDVELGVIGDVAPKGLCGSGLVDAVAELVRVGLLDASGGSSPRRTRRRSPPRWPTG